LIPQAPFHTTSLCVQVHNVSNSSSSSSSATALSDGAPATPEAIDAPENDSNKDHTTPTTTVDHVVEQRVSNLAQGLLTLGTMTGPLLVVVHLIPQGVLAGLFLVMGIQALLANGIILKILYLLRDRAYSRADPLRTLPNQRKIWLFVAIQLLGFGATFAVTQTVAAIGFPIIIMALIPLRAFLIPRWFTRRELSVLDAPTASPFTMESVGGQKGVAEEEEEVRDAVIVGGEKAERGEGGLRTDGEGREVIDLPDEEPVTADVRERRRMQRGGGGNLPAGDGYRV